MTTISGDISSKTVVTFRPEPEVAQSARHRIARRLLPFLFLLYVIAFLDRTNISTAALQMPRELGFDDRVLGFGSGIFFAGYFLLEIPGAVESARPIARIMISWDLRRTMASSTLPAFYVVLSGRRREAGFFPMSSSTLRIGSGTRTGLKPSHFSTRRILFRM